MSEPPRWTIRRTAAILAASVLLLVLTGLPAWAGASIAPDEVPADTDVSLTLRVTEPEDEAYGDTARVTLRAPSGFTGLACGTMPTGWECTANEGGTELTLARFSPVALAASRDFGFSVHTPVFNGQYWFRVAQADGPPSEEDPPATASARPAVTVIEGKAPPEPSPTPSPTAAPDSGSDDGGSQDGGGSQPATGGDSQPPDGTSSSGSTSDGDSGSGAASTDDGTDDDGTSGGSTAPRRTQGRASGTTLEIIPGEPTDDGPDVAPPDVADDPAIAPPSDAARTGEDADTTTVAANGTQASEQPGGDTPWQQWVGAAMLLVGGAVVAIRRWGLMDTLRGLEPLALVQRWRRD